MTTINVISNYKNLNFGWIFLLFGQNGKTLVISRLCRTFYTTLSEKSQTAFSWQQPFGLRFGKTRLKL